MHRIWVVGAIVLGLATACGSSSDESATVKWAGGVCSAVSDWQSALAGVTTDLKQSSLRQDDLTSAWDDAKSATQSLADDLEGLGKPDTKAGQEAQAAVDELQTSLTSNVDTMQTAVDGATNVSGVLTAVSVASGTLVTMGDQITSTVDQLRQIDDPQGELQAAFKQAGSCQDLAAS